MELTRWTVHYTHGGKRYTARVLLNPDPASPTYSTADDIPKIIENATGRENVKVRMLERQA